MAGLKQRVGPDRIGRYELLRRLATGGMAELFLAKASGIEGFEKVLVLKRILPHLAEDAEFVRMFLTEARLAATLDHANIVHVHDIGKEAGEYFFTMEYVHGEDLRRVIQRASEHHARIPLGHALTIVTAVAAGLHHAHEQIGYDGRPLGIIHRDVSPSNIIVKYGGGVKVLDFGIAKAGARTNVSRLSTLKGKATYMSPEQCRGATLDRRSDIFSIAILLQELLTMKPVYRDKNELMIMHKVASGDVPPIREAWPECPPELQNILSRALQREPRDRYATALQFQLDLEAFAHDHRVQLSMAALGQYLQDLFGTKPYPWIEGAVVPGPQASPKAEPSITPVARPPVNVPMPTVVAVPTTDSDPMLVQPSVDITVRKPNPTHERTAKIDAQPAPPMAHVTDGFTQVTMRPKRNRWVGIAVASVVAGGVAYAVGVTRQPSNEATPTDAEPVVPTSASALPPEDVSAVVTPPAVAPPQAEPLPSEATVVESPAESAAEQQAEPAPTPTTRPRKAPEPEPEEPVEIEVIEDAEPAPPTKPAPKPRRRRPNPDPDGLLP